MGGKKGGNRTPSVLQKTVSLREEATGRKQSKGGSANVKSILKHEHLQKIAVWMSGEASIPSSAAFFGHRLAADGEASGIPPDPSLFTCQRCETVLQPGFNCTVRIEKNKAKGWRKLKNTLTKNNVVYKCHFCSHWNLKRGTPKGHMNEICPPKLKPTRIPKLPKSTLEKPASLEKECDEDKLDKVDRICSPVIAAETPTSESPVTPFVTTRRTLLDVKRRKSKKSGSKRPVESDNNSPATDSVNAPSKKKRKSWVSLREMVERSGQ